MSDKLITSIVTVLIAIIGAAILATLLSNGANTTGIFSSGSSAFGGALGTALSPLSGGSNSLSESVHSYLMG